MKRKFKAFVIFAIGCLLFTGCGKDNGVDNKISLNAPKDIKVETFYSEDNSNLILRLTNESNNDIKDLDIISTYPTAADDLISEDEIFLKNFKASSTTYVSLMLPIDDDFEPYIPSKIDLDILTDSENLEDMTDTSEMVDLIKLDYTVNNNVIDFNLTNDTGKIIGSVSAIVVYFKDNKPIATDYIDALNVNETYNSERDILYYGNEDDMQYIDYDNLEIYITNIIDDYIPEEYDGEGIPEYDDDELEDEPIEEDDDLSWDY